MNKYNLIWTLDYEIHGNGDGNPMELMVEPTYRLMNLLEKYHQRLTIMADVAEILCFKRYLAETGRDDYHVAEIEEQLRDAIRRGHEVQLHIHSSYFKAVHNGHSFDQCIEEYNMAALPIERIDEMVTECIAYLENLLRPVKKDYKVWLFRAANWSMMPTENLYKVLVKNGITHDTSVFKGGVQGGNVCYDYREAYDNLFAYPASEKNINIKDERGELIELPIYTEMRPFWDFISVVRIFRMVRAKFHRHKTKTQINTASADINIDKEDNPKKINENTESTAYAASNVIANQSANEQDSLQPSYQLPTTDANELHLLDSSQKIVSLPKNDEKGSLQTNANENDNRKLSIKSFFRLSPLKMDYNQVNARGLKRMMRNVIRRVNSDELIVKSGEINVILIGHAKTFVPYNERRLEPFLKWIDKNINN